MKHRINIIIFLVLKHCEQKYSTYLPKITICTNLLLLTIFSRSIRIREETEKNPNKRKEAVASKSYITVYLRENLKMVGI